MWVSGRRPSNHLVEDSERETVGEDTDTGPRKHANQRESRQVESIGVAASLCSVLVTEAAVLALFPSETELEALGNIC